MGGYPAGVNDRDSHRREDARAALGRRLFAFDSFVLTEATRALGDGERRVDLPPRYFDLLVFLIEERDRVVTKDDLYERIWKDEIVTEGAIAQGVRFLRRALGDDARNPRFIRTVAKFGYQWIGILREPSPPSVERRPEVIGRVSKDSPNRDPVTREIPLAMEIAAAFRIALGRYASASLGSAVAGAIAGSLGAVFLLASSSPANPTRAVLALALLGFVIGGIGGLGVGFGLSFAESLIRRSRAAFLAVAGAISGALIGGLAHAAVAETFTALFGRLPQAFGGAYEGLWIGAFVGFGYGLSTRDLALAAPREWNRLRVVGIAALFAAMGAAFGSALGANFTGASVDAIATLFRGSELSLASLGSWMGEPGFGRLSRIALSAYEGLFFGAGLVYGLTRRPATRS